MEVKCRIWVEDDAANRVMGSGVIALLRGIDEYRSLNQAAANLRMSYRNAWGKIEKTEARLGIRLVERTVGGSRGGGSCLTPEGRAWLEAFAALERDLDTTLDELRDRHLARLEKKPGPGGNAFIHDPGNSQ